MSFIPMIHSGVFAPFLARAAREGDWFLEELWTAGLPLSLAEGSAFIIPFESAIKFVSRSASRLDAPDLGLQVGAATNIRSLPNLGDALANSATLRDAINAVVATLPSVTTVRRVWLESDSKTATLCHASPSISLAGSEHAEQFALMLLINLVREVAGKTWSPHVVTVSPSTLRLIGHRSELLSDSRLTAGPCTSFTFDAALLSRRLPAQSPETSGSGSLPEHHWPEVPVDFLGTFIATLEANLRSGRVGLEFLTHTLGKSSRTLQRELASNGVTYEHLLAEARLRVARELLAKPETRVADVAFELGYQDAANFTRAFKRWTGVTPMEYRNDFIVAKNASD